MFSSVLKSISFPSADIVDRVAPKLSELSISFECIGGGRIKHDATSKTIFVYGYSVVRINPISIKLRML